MEFILSTPVLLVEDDKRLSVLISDFLTQQGFTVKTLGGGKHIEETMRSFVPKVVVLDIMLPGEDGFSICQRLRRSYDGPLLFLTAKSSDFDQVIGLEIGADDYIIKPVEPRVLLARIQALLRRSESKANTDLPLQQSVLTFGKLSLHRQSRQVELGKENVQLTSHEFDMLWMLAMHPAQLVKREVLYNELIGREYDGLDRSADVRISRLRKKLHDNPQKPFRIKTIWGKGFFFVPDAWD
ncbi:MAG: two-component system OmpR family response regulator/two-component system response regulator RstA [Glaciecola sp.]